MLRNWLPVVVMLLLIRVESTDMMSGNNTGHLLQSLMRWLHISLPPSMYGIVNLVMRKTGHVLGYGLIAYLFFRGYRGSIRWRNGLGWRIQASEGWAWRWRTQWAMMGVGFAALVASADEIHQMTIPSRTGSWHDVLLDSMAGVFFLFACWLWNLHRDRTA